MMLKNVFSANIHFLFVIISLLTVTESAFSQSRSNYGPEYWALSDCKTEEQRCIRACPQDEKLKGCIWQCQCDLAFCEFTDLGCFIPASDRIARACGRWTRRIKRCVGIGPSKEAQKFFDDLRTEAESMR